MKACSIFKTDKEYKIITQSETDIGLFIDDGPVFILPIESAIENIKDVIFVSLNNSRKDIPTPKPDEWSKWQKERLKKMKEKTFTELNKKSNYVGIRLEGGVLTINPGKYTPKEGIGIVEEDVLKIEYSSDKEMDIIKKIIEILKVDYKGSVS